jgi:nucleotide-binding universal stress UspA family protein
MIRNVMVPLDGSTFAEHALPLALGIARRAGASLQLVRVHQMMPPPGVVGPGFIDHLDLEVRKHELAYLDVVVRRLNAWPPVPTAVVLLDGDPVSALEDHAASAGADLVVMSTHGRGPLGRFWLGSVADELVRRLPVPLLLVRPGDGAPDLGRALAPEHLLLPLDGTPLAEQILGPAVALGSLPGTRFTLVRVVKPALGLNHLPDGGPLAGMTPSLRAQVETAQKPLQDEAHAYLKGVAARLRECDLRVQTRVIVEEHPAAGILREARAQAVDVIALETHGRRGLSRLLLGSVADKVVRGGTVPVLVHRPWHP